MIYAGGGYFIWAFAAATGKVMWRTGNLTQDIATNPVSGAVVRGTPQSGRALLYTTTHTSVYALSDVDGSVVWNATVPH